LLVAIFILPLNYVLTSVRWHLLLESLGIRISPFRTLVINLVGAFYNAFMPGTTGGDLIKAYYASKHTTHRTRAVLSVLIDRAIGLLALILVSPVATEHDTVASSGRYLLAAIPCFLLLGRLLTQRPALQLLVLGSGFMLQALLAAVFLSGGPVL
jgi:uncharacterized protein (TIRG00374 family)